LGRGWSLFERRVGLITKHYFQRWEERRRGANVREQGIRKKREC